MCVSFVLSRTKANSKSSTCSSRNIFFWKAGVSILIIWVFSKKINREFLICKWKITRISLLPLRLWTWIKFHKKNKIKHQLRTTTKKQRVKKTRTVKILSPFWKRKYYFNLISDSYYSVESRRITKTVYSNLQKRLARLLDPS